MFKFSTSSLRISPRLLICIAALSTANVALLYLFMKCKYSPPDIKRLKVHSPDEAPLIRRGQNVTVFSWNLQFMASNECAHFFYDGGNDPWPSKEKIMQTIEKVSKLIKKANPDIIILQELAKDSITSQYVNEFEELKKQLPTEYSSYVSAYYLKSKFIPHPKVLGPSYLKLYIISKYKITEATRYALPSLDSFDWISRLLGQFFGFKRAILEAVIPIEDGTNFHVLNTHFSAYSQGSNTLQQQADRANGLMSNLPENDEGILAGDLNCLGRDHDDTSPSPLSQLFHRFAAVPSQAALHSTDTLEWATFFPQYENPRYNETLDFMFFTNRLRLENSRVVDKETAIRLSDHLPLEAEVKPPTCL